MSVTKVTLNLPSELVESLKSESTAKNISVTETIRRSLETGIFLSSEERSGAKILLERSNGKTVQIVRT
jgi:hypothetical protein